jgi:hypothetical protein
LIGVKILSATAIRLKQEAFEMIPRQSAGGLERVDGITVESDKGQPPKVGATDGRGTFARMTSLTKGPPAPFASFDQSGAGERDAFS